MYFQAKHVDVVYLPIDALLTVNRDAIINHPVVMGLYSICTRHPIRFIIQ